MIIIPGQVPIRIHPLFFGMAALIGWLSTQNLTLMFIWMGVIFFSILIHEFGHAYTAVYFRQKAAITLMAMGGLTSRHGPPLKLWQEFLIVLNGPLASFSLYGVTAYIANIIHEPHELLKHAFLASMFINWVWTLLNLIPLGPLDGGRLLSIIFEAVFGSKGIKASLLIGIAFGTLVVTWGLINGLLFLSVIFFILTFDTLRMYQSATQLTDQDRKGEIQAAFQLAEHAYIRGDLLEALEKFQQIRYSTQSGMLFNASTEYMARILSDQGEFEEAFTLLKPIQGKLSSEALLLFHRLAYHCREIDTLIKIGSHAFDIDGSYDTAFINAAAHASRGDVQKCIGWLQAAKREGMTALKENLGKKDFDPVRSQPEFIAFVSALEQGSEPS